MLESYRTEGTFTRKKIFECIRKFVHSGKVAMYPGRHSVWIMDGARIHCDKHIILYLRSVGILPVFLPAYCPMFNPIEVVFGLGKQDLKKHYVENSNTPLSITVTESLTRFARYNCTNLFKKCDYYKDDRYVAPEQPLDEFGFDVINK